MLEKPQPQPKPKPKRRVVGFGSPARAARRGRRWERRDRTAMDALRIPGALRVPGYKSKRLLLLLRPWLLPWLLLWLWPLRLNPVMGRRVGADQARRVAGRKPASSLSAHGRAVSEPRSPLAQSDVFSSDRSIRAAFFCLLFLAVKKSRSRAEGVRKLLRTSASVISIPERHAPAPTSTPAASAEDNKATQIKPTQAAPASTRHPATNGLPPRPPGSGWTHPACA